MRQSIGIPEFQNQWLEPTGLATSGTTPALTGTGQGVARHEAAGRVVGWVWNWTNPFLQFKPGLLTGYLDKLPTLLICKMDVSPITTQQILY